MTKKETRLQKSTRILSTAKFTQWCYVDIHNNFYYTYTNKNYVISDNVEDYFVYNKAGEVEDYTNEAYMEEVLAVTDVYGNLSFYNQNYDLIEDRYVREVSI